MKKTLFKGFSNPTLTIVVEIIIGTFVSLSVALFFFYISSKLSSRNLQAVDVMTSQIIYNLRTPEVTRFFVFITNLGSSYTLIFMTLFTIALAYRHHRREALLFVLVVLMGFMINFALKNIIERPRPDISPLISESTYSFPSGHAMNSFVFYTTLSFYIYHFTRRKLLSLVVTIFSIIIILLIGLSRVYLGVHYPSDILAGYVVGFWWFVTALVIEKTLDFYQVFRDKYHH